MLTVHHLGISQSERIVWLCEELAIPYELKRYDRHPVTRLAPAEYRALHPVGTAPIITDGDLVLPESGAIMEYIIATYGNGRLAVRSDAPNFAAYLFWFHFANGSVMPSQLGAIGAGPEEAQAGPIVRMQRERSERAWNLIESRLGETPYLAGPALTAADIMMLFPLTNMRRFAPRDISGCPNIRAYLQRIGERPPYCRAMQKADPHMPPLLS